MKYKRVVDNKMRWQGDIDDEKNIIRINKEKSKKKSSIIDTIVHEEMHKDHPKMHEKTVRDKTTEKVKRLINPQKYYNKYK